MKIKVGHRSYKVLPLPQQLRKRYHCSGLISFLEQTIHIQKLEQPNEQARLLIHELTHAIFAGVGDRGKKLDEEQVCSMVDNGFAMIFQDNPELLGVLHQALNRGKAIV